MRAVWSVCVLVVLLACASCASGAPDATLQVIDAWARPASAGGTSAVYFSVQNNTSADDTLLSASSDSAGMVEIHQTTIDDNGAMQMQHQAEGVDIPAGTTVLFAPGGLHVMLVNLPQDLAAGSSVTLRLQFAQAGEITVQAEVREP